MSFRSLLNRAVTVQHGTPAATPDAHGNRPRTFTDLAVDVPARREQEEASEQIDGRDQQRRTVIYFLPLSYDDEDLTILEGQDRILDGDDIYEIDGPPDVVEGTRAAHHLEVRAYLITG